MNSSDGVKVIRRRAHSSHSPSITALKTLQLVIIIEKLREEVTYFDENSHGFVCTAGLHLIIGRFRSFATLACEFSSFVWVDSVCLLDFASLEFIHVRSPF